MTPQLLTAMIGSGLFVAISGFFVQLLKSHTDKQANEIAVKRFLLEQSSKETDYEQLRRVELREDLKNCEDRKDKIELENDRLRERIEALNKRISELESNIAFLRGTKVEGQLLPNQPHELP